MTDSKPEEPKNVELSATVSQSWRRFLETYEPLRPELYRFCRYLSRSPWDAEDLVQDTLDHRLLRACSNRPRHGCAADKPEELAPFHVPTLCRLKA